MEYKIRFRFPDTASVTAFLHRLPMVGEAPGASNDFEFREAGNTGSMPDASAHVVPDGLYFCDHGGQGEQFLGVVVACLVSEFGPVTVADLE
ncbi:MAG: hypothetical protein WCK10_02875 [Candidatus Staskawiczbacteria bacterium]